MELRNYSLVMPSRIPESELEDILKIVAQFSDGASVDDIRAGLEKPVPRRTLQYRLAKLVASEKLQATGKGRGSRYRLPGAVLQVDSLKHDHFVDEVSLETYVPISAESERIKARVRAPIQVRQPVGYNREFLDSYRPNESYYLPQDIRQQLLNIGQAPNEQRPAGTYAKQIFNRLLIDLSWNSSRLEGNTYSLLETQLLLELGESADGKNAKEAQMILNHKSAIELLVEESAEIGFTRHGILSIHALLSDNLLDDSEACGRLRNKTVEIGGSVYHPPTVPQIIEECFQQILDSATVIRDPYEQAFFVMVHLPYLQPFEDVNKRVSRLAVNIPFIRENLSPLSFIDVPERAYVDGILAVYELNRIELLRDVFVWAYERSCARYSAVSRTLGEPDPFRLRYRSEVAKIVTQVVQGHMDKKFAAAYIKQCADKMLPRKDRLRFIEVVETQLMSLHEGNIARYKIQLSQYSAWQEKWK